MPLWLPARSLQVPLTEAAALSGPPYVTWVQPPAAMPDVASVPAKATPTGWLNQPFASVGRAGLAPVDLGRGRVVPEHEGAGRAVAGQIAAGAVDGGACVVGARVALGRVAGLDSGGRIRAGEADRERGPVPAVGVGSPARRRRRLRRGRVVLEPERRRARVPGPVLAASDDCGERAVRARVRLLRLARGHAGRCVGAGEADRRPTRCTSRSRWAGRVGVAVACGAVASYLSVRDGVAALPATSRQVPPTEAAASSGPE